MSVILVYSHHVSELVESGTVYRPRGSHVCLIVLSATLALRHWMLTIQVTQLDDAEGTNAVAVYEGACREAEQAEQATKERVVHHPRGDGFSRGVYTAFPPAIGSHDGPLLRIVAAEVSVAVP
eukprot:6588510-Pyramimonas_sp.AAC.2